MLRELTDVSVRAPLIFFKRSWQFAEVPEKAHVHEGSGGVGVDQLCLSL